MRAAELVSMLTAHGVRIGHIPGGTPSLTAHDIAGAMGMCLSPFESSLVLARYALDAQQYGEARVYWFVAVMARKAKEGWSSDKPGCFKGLADITLEEWVQDNNCKACNGVGSTMVGQLKTECESCGGTGKRYMSERALSKAIGIGRTAYAAHWKSRVDWCRKELVRLEMTALYRLNRALIRDVDTASHSR